MPAVYALQRQPVAHCLTLDVAAKSIVSAKELFQKRIYQSAGSHNLITYALMMKLVTQSIVHAESVLK